MISFGWLEIDRLNTAIGDAKAASGHVVAEVPEG
jgi:hypothetical protein